ncbi:exported protein of unknown function [Tenacibaculum soleae]|uniref:hypothetical protein n=1 Tax=Tenacibaculum soleae TaxID=447689 RepID=UPI003AB4A72E
MKLVNCFFLLWFFNCLSQSNNSGIGMNYMPDNIKQNTIFIGVDDRFPTFLNNKENKEKKISGTIFFSENNSKLIVFLKNKKKYHFDNGNYNVKTNDFVVSIENDSLFIFDTKNVDYFRFKGEKFKKYFYKDGVKRFFSVLTEKNNKNILLKGYFIKIQPGQINSLTKVKLTNDKYSIKYKYYLKKGDDIKEIKLKKREILKALNKKREKIINYVDKKDLSFKKEKDVIKIFNYYNSI